MATFLEGGHTETVLCCAASKTGQILSGGEGGQLCVWSLDGAQPKVINISGNGEDVTSICCSQQNIYTFWAACGQKLLAFDLRHLDAPLYTFEQNEDEINQIVLHEKEDYLAACDDSGQIKVFNLPERRVYKTLKKHTNICACIGFRPKRPWDLLSGGFDYYLLQWDFSRNRSVCNINMEEVGLDQELPNSYMVSPPFIYSLSISRSGHQVACGTENALIQLFDASRRTLTFMASLRAHNHGVSQVHFPDFQDNLLISGGNDGKLFFWDTSPCAAGAEVINGAANGVHNGIANGVQNGVANGVHHGVANGVHNGVANGVANGVHHGVANGVHNGVANGVHNGIGNAVANGVHNGVEDGLEDDEDDHVNVCSDIGPKNKYLQRPSLLPKYRIDHGKKVQWLTSLMRNGQPILVVADNSNKLSLYNIPQ